jgi:ATP-dependent helicase/nuclease subunit B
VKIIAENKHNTIFHLISRLYMIKIITSLSSKNRLEHLKSRLKSTKTGVLIVPEQFLFETERSMYNLLGARKIAVTDITGFSKLAGDVIKIHGTPKLYADDVVKSVTMYKTLNHIKSKLTYFKEASYEFSQQMLELVASLKSASITPDVLETQLFLDENVNSDKFNDITQIYSAYCLALEHDFADKLDDVRIAAKLISQHDCFSGKEVFFHEFDSFSKSQLELIKAVSDSAEAVEILMRTDTPNMRGRLHGDYMDLGGRSHSPAIELWTADNVCDECEFIAKKIHSLITQEDYTLNEIAVLECDSANTSRLKEAMKEYDISCYADLPEPIITKSMTRFIVTALEAVSLTTPELLSYVRSPFSRLSLIEMDLLERNAYRYALTKKEWANPFPEKNKDLWGIEPLRKQVVQPLIKLRKDCKNKTGAEISEVLCEFLLETMQLQKTVLSLCNSSCGSENELLENKSLTEEFRQLWDLIIDVFESLHETLKAYDMTITEYTELIRGVFSSVNIAKPPQVLDAVAIGDLERSRHTDIRVAFIMGANSCCFPKGAGINTGIFSGKELEALSEDGLEISAGLEERYNHERFIVEKALTLPSQRLYLSAPLSSVAWEELTPSPMFEELLDKGTADKIYHYKKLHKNTQPTPPITTHILTSETSQKLFSFESFSPTAIESLMSCRFKFFCKYGMGIDIPVAENEEEPISLERGNIIHYCLERAVRVLHELDDSNIDGFVNSCIQEYREIKLPKGYAQTNRQRYIMMSFKPGIIRMLKHFQRDLAHSVFKPVGFEEKFDFMLGNTRLTGKIDRIDQSSFGGFPTASGACETLVRVIDYKSGNKELNFPSVFYGLNLQMLIYLFSQCSGRSETRKPASALYMPSDGVKTNGILMPGTDEPQMRKSWLESHIPSGIVVDDECLSSQEARYREESGSTARKSFFKVKKLTPSSYDRLQNYCEKLINTQVSRVKRGNVEAYPVETACDYCEFSLACKNNGQKIKPINVNSIERII